MTLCCVIPGPTVVIVTGETEDHWCFGCRKHLPHQWVLLDDPPERQPSWYDPVWVRRCSGCGRDDTRFPGS